MTQPIASALVAGALLTGLAAVVGATDVTIPDDGLRGRIEAALRKAAGDPITVADMAALTSLGSGAACGWRT